MSETKNPAIQPGEGARAIDTFRMDYIANSDCIQAENDLKAHQLAMLSDGLDYYGEYTCMVAYLAGYAPEMPVRVARDIVVKLIKERRHIE